MLPNGLSYNTLEHKGFANTSRCLAISFRNIIKGKYITIGFKILILHGIVHEVKIIGIHKYGAEGMKVSIYQATRKYILGTSLFGCIAYIQVFYVICQNRI